MLTNGTKRLIDTARDILVGKLPDPKSQVEQITIALIYKFMDDMDKQSEELGGKAKFFTSEYAKYAWSKIFDPRVSGHELVGLYGEAIQRMNHNPNIPQLFRDIFKNAYLPYRDPETLKSFLKAIGEFEYDHSEKLGDAFEYLLSVMGSQGDAGQFRTPRHIIDFIVEVVEPGKNETILDPACGTAGFLISSYKHILEKNKKDGRVHLTPAQKKRLIENFSGYDISPDMVRLSLVNMYLHGFKNPKIYEYDTLTSEEKWQEVFDVILANPPFMSPKGGIRPHKRFSVECKRSEVLFVDYIVEHLTPHGRAAVIVPEGIVFKGDTAYKKLRKNLVDKNLLVGVISLPAGIFNPYSGIKTYILWIDRTLAKKTDEILFVQIENDGFDLGAQRRSIKDNDLPQAYTAIMRYKHSLSTEQDFVCDTPQLTKSVKKSEIAQNGNYTLKGEQYGITKAYKDYKWSMVELGEILDYEQPTSYIVKSTNYNDEYKTPVLTAGKSFILGYTNESEGIFKKKLPVIIFDDFTTATKFVDFPFKVKSSAMKILLAKKDKANIKFIFYVMKKIDFNSSTHKRYWISEYSKIKIPLPPLSEQEKIITELEGYQKIIDGSRQVIKSYKPHIDIDSNWPLVELGKVCDFKRGPFGGSLKKDIFVESGYCVYEQGHAIGDNFNEVRYFITEEKFKEMKQFEVSSGDLIMSCSGTMGKIAIAPENVKLGIINQALLKLTPTDKVDNYYLKHIMESGVFQSALMENTYGTAIKNVASVKILKNIKVPLPDIATQRDIVKKLGKEQSIVDGNKQLAEAFEQRVKDRIAKVWGEKAV